jgi:hypothetical protein
MVKVRYIPNQGALDSYYRRQSGGGGDPYFHGAVYQRGHGLGGLFGKLFGAAVPLFKNTVAPMLKKGAKAVAREAVRTGVGVAGDMLHGHSGTESYERRSGAAVNRLGQRGVKKLSRMIDKPKVTRRKTIRRADLLDK